MKAIKHFVKAVIIDKQGRALNTSVLTPAMDTCDQACDYLNWLYGTVSGSKIKLLVRNDLTDSIGDQEFDSVVFMKIETTLY